MLRTTFTVREVQRTVQCKAFSPQRLKWAFSYGENPLKDDCRGRSRWYAPYGYFGFRACPYFAQRNSIKNLYGGERGRDARSQKSIFSRVMQQSARVIGFDHVIKIQSKPPQVDNVVYGRLKMWNFFCGWEEDLVYACGVRLRRFDHSFLLSFRIPGGSDAKRKKKRKNSY